MLSDFARKSLARQILVSINIIGPAAERSEHGPLERYGLFLPEPVQRQRMRPPGFAIAPFQVRHAAHPEKRVEI